MRRILLSFVPALVGFAPGSLCEAKDKMKKPDSGWVGTSQYWKHRPDNSWVKDWDGRESLSKENETDNVSTGAEGGVSNTKRRKTHVILMIRHGQYEQADSDADRVLTPLGREQAVLTGKRLAELLRAKKLPPVKHLYYSTMARATETGLLIANELAPTEKTMQVSPCSMIREGAVTEPDPPSWRWRPTEEKFLKEGFRVEAGFLNHVHRPDKDEEESYTTVLVCHGNVIRYFTLRALQLQPEAWLRMAVFNASVTALSVDGETGTVSLRGLGDVGHFKPDQITYS